LEEPEGESTKMHYNLRGIMKDGDSWLFSLYDQAAGRSFWLSPGQSRGGVAFVDYDPQSGSLTVQHSGEQHVLKMADPDAEPIPVATSQTIATNEKTFDIPSAPTFTPPAPPNGGRAPETPAPIRSPRQITNE
jgi:hypothetical protein